jgi:uncharacterized protein
MKLLLLVAFIALVVMWLSRPKQVRRPPQPSQPRIANEPILPCAECGVHAPASEMLMDAAGKAYCCEEHRSRHAVR